MTLYNWSKTAASNTTADTTTPWPEGMAPSAVNDSARGLMAAVAKYRDDNAGLTTSGTSTAFTVTTNQVFTSLALMDGAKFVIIPHTTSGASPTLNVDGLGAKSLRMATGATPATGAFKQGTPYAVTYSNSNSEFVAHGLAGAFGATTFTGAITGTDETLTGTLTLSGTGAMQLNSGTTAQRPSPTEGFFRHNSTLHVPEYYDGTTWNTLTPALPEPQGYLTPVTGTPVITSDSTSATVIYYTPVRGLWNPIHNGTSLIPYQLSGELSLTLTSSQSASGIYDIFLCYNSGTPVIGTGPSWSAGTSGSVTAGSCARGTGSGGTALTRLNGVLVNTASMSVIWNTGSGNTTITVGANQGVYLGSIYIDGSAGQVTCHRSYGQSRKWGIWNMYNRRPIYLKMGDATASWTYATNTWRQSNAAAGNTLMMFSGLAEEIADIQFNQRGQASTNSTVVSALQNGIGINSTTSPSGKYGYMTAQQANPTNVWGDMVAAYKFMPTIGINAVNCIEIAPVNSTAQTFYGTEAAMVMSAVWRG